MKDKYIQIGRSNETTAIYYDLENDECVELRDDKRIKFSVKYQLGILAVLYAGYMLNAYCKAILDENRNIKTMLIVLCVLVGVISFEILKKIIAGKIQEKGKRSSIVINQELLESGIRQMKLQKLIIYLWGFFMVCLMLAFCFTNFIMWFLLFLAGMIIWAGMLATARPIKKIKVCRRLLGEIKDRQNL